MRSEQEMLELILGTARDYERIRAVYLNGSRANPNAPKDIFRDFDIVYVVTDTAPFLTDRHWIDRFGKILLMEEPDQLDLILGENLDFTQRYACLLYTSPSPRD